MADEGSNMFQTRQKRELRAGSKNVTHSPVHSSSKEANKAFLSCLGKCTGTRDQESVPYLLSKSQSTVEA